MHKKCVKIFYIYLFANYFESYAKMKICTIFSKSKTPLNTPLSTWFFFVGYAFFLCLFCILNIFEKKIDVNSDVNFRSDVRFYWSHMLKNSKKCNFWKEHKKIPQKMGWMPKWRWYFESYAQMKILGRWRQFLTSTSPKISEISNFPRRNDYPIF